LVLKQGRHKVTRIIVDKEIALKAVCQYFGIPVLGTEPEFYVGSGIPAYPIEIEFDFECKHEAKKRIACNKEITESKSFKQHKEKYRKYGQY